MPSTYMMGGKGVWAGTGLEGTVATALASEHQGLWATY